MTNDTVILFRGLASERPASPTAIDQGWISTDTGEAYIAKNNAGTLSWQAIGSSGGGGSASYPKACWFGDLLESFAIMNQGVWTRHSDPPALYGVEYYQDSTANGNNFDLPLFLAAGTYNFSVHSDKDANRGIVDWAIDGTNVVTGQDWYSASTVNQVTITNSVVIATDGFHKLTGTVNGKNASSSNYYLVYVAIWFKPSAY